jgi:hypothetical protein
MSLIALTAAKGAPGVTTTAIALAGVWPRAVSGNWPVLLAECDPSGGDVALRLRGPGQRVLAQDRGMISLAAAIRQPDFAEPMLWDHVQTLDGGLPVLISPSAPRLASAIEVTWPLVAGALAGLRSTDVIADCGRLHDSGGGREVLARADVVVMLVTPSVPAVAHLRYGIEALTHGDASAARPDRIGVVVVVDQRRRKSVLRDIAAFLARDGLPATVLGAIALDPVGAAGLSGHWGSRVDRTELVSSTRAVASTLVGVLGDQAARAARTFPDREREPARATGPVPTARVRNG